MIAQSISSLEYLNKVRSEETLRSFKTSKLCLIACSRMCIYCLQLHKLIIKISKQHMSIPEFNSCQTFTQVSREWRNAYCHEKLSELVGK